MSKSKAWFIKTRGSYLPNLWKGWLLYLPYLVYLIAVVVFVIKIKDSIWAAIFTVVPNWVAAVIIMTWVARRRS
jgi:hypothetical protein